MAFSNFIPEIWSARLLEHMDKVHVYANLMNRDYEGDIKAYGDTVHINLLGEITINDYSGSDISDPQELDSTQQNLVIDKAKYFNFMVKDIDNAQSNPKLVDAAMVRASYNMNDVIDQYLAGLLLAGVATDNVLYSDTTAVTPTHRRGRVRHQADAAAKEALVCPEGKELGSCSAIRGVSPSTVSQGRGRSTRCLRIPLVNIRLSSRAIRPAAPAFRVFLKQSRRTDRAIHISPLSPRWV